MKRHSPEVIELNVEQLERHLQQIEQALGEATAQPFRQLIQWYLHLQRIIQRKNLSISRLRDLLFGARTERTRLLNDETATPSTDSTAATNALPTTTDAANLTGLAELPDGAAPRDNNAPLIAGPVEPNESSLHDGRVDADDLTQSQPDTKKERRQRPGHGRTPASAYAGCEQILVSHESLVSGDFCPSCADGIVYRQKDWRIVVRLVGRPPVGGQRYELERLRCGLCGDIFTAQLPDDAGASKFDPTVASTVATLHYGYGMPWNRLEQIQAAAGIPLPASTQYEQARDALDQGPSAVYQQLLHDAAQGQLVHNDDTTMRVLELSDKKKHGQPIHDTDPDRSGVYTSGVLSIAEDRPVIALFFTGARHAGENLQDLLAKRADELSPPLQMCDGLSHNLPEELATIVANCLSHGRRKFFELRATFPDKVRYVLDRIKVVYQVDAEARTAGDSPDERLRRHQLHSEPVMNELHAWLQGQLDERQTEPNSTLGVAIRYLLKRWSEFTRFLRQPGVPLDNNICERALKLSIRYRKNSLFYKTQRSAKVGDTYQSLIHTCHLSKVDPIDYLTQLQRNAAQVIAAPSEWLPWNYRQRISSEPAECSVDASGERG